MAFLNLKNILHVCNISMQICARDLDINFFSNIFSFYKDFRGKSNFVEINQYLFMAISLDL